MRFSISYKISLTLILVLGLITPFVHYLHVIEMFFLIIPIVIIFLGTLLFFIISLIFSNKKLRKDALVWLLPLFIFIFSQFASVFVIDKLFSLWSKNLISKIEAFKNKNGEYPESLDKVANYVKGIDYKLIDQNKYQLQYNRGFFVREVYSNTDKNWETFGWND